MPNASQIAKLSNMTKGNLYSYKLETRIFESFYDNELHVKLCSLYHSDIKHSLTEVQKEYLEKLVRDHLDKLTIPISNATTLSKSEIQILLYSSISLIIGAYHFEHEYEDGFNALTPEDIYLPRLKVMWSIF